MVAGPTLRTAELGGETIGIVTTVDCSNLNEAIKEGWVLEKTIVHHSVEHDCTIIAFLLKKD